MSTRTPFRAATSAALAAAASIALATRARAQATEYVDYALYSAAAPPAAVVGFDELAPGVGALSSTQYAGLGLTIVQRDGLAMNVLNFGSNSLFPSGNFNSMPNVISSADGPGFDCPACSDNFDFILSPPRASAGIWIGNIHMTSVQFLDAAGAVIAQKTFTTSSPGLIVEPGPSWNNRIFYGVVSSVPVATIRTVEPCCDGDGICYDDVQWGDVPGVAKFGASTRSCVGPLSIGVNSIPKVGNASFALTCSNAGPSAPGFLGLSAGALAVPLAILGVDVWINPLGVLVLPAASDAAGSVTHSLAIPGDPGLAGETAYAQFVFLSACGPQGFSASDAIALTIQP